MDTSQRLAVIGCGRMGQRHVAVFQSLGFTNIAICDTRQDALHNVGTHCGLSEHHCFTNAHRLLSSFCPTILVVATTAPSHCELSCLAIECGVRYVICEKPLACSIAECEQMIATCNRLGAHLAVNHQVRYMPAYALAKQIIDSSEFGNFTSMTVAGGNGGLAMIGSHLFEAFRWLTGERVDTVQAWLSSEKVPNPRGAEFEDYGGCIRALTPSGKRLYVDLSADQGHNLTIVYSGRFGQVIVEPLAGEIRSSVRKADDRHQPTTRYATAGERHIATFDPLALEASQALIRDLISGRGFPTGEDGKHAVECLIATHLSHENGHIPIRLAELEPFKNRKFRWA